MRSAPGSPDGDASEYRPPASASRKVQRRLFGDYVQLLWPLRLRLAWILLMAVAGMAIELCWPLISRHMIDDVVLAGDMPASGRMRQLAIIGGCAAALFLLNGLLTLRRNLRLARLNAQLALALRRRLFAHILRLPLGDIQAMKTGGAVSRLSHDVDSAMNLVQSAALNPAMAALRLIIALGIMLMLNWKIAATAILVMPAVLLLHNLWIRRIRPIWRSVGEDRSEIDAKVAESIGGIRVVRACSRESRECLQFGIGHHTLLRKALFAARAQQCAALAWDLVMPATQLTIVWYGGLLVVSGQATIGTLVAFQGYFWRLIDPVMTIVNSISETQRGLAGMERVLDVLDQPQDKPDLPHAVLAPKQVDEMRFENVTFAYVPGRAVISDFTLTVPGGSVVGLVGPSGAGKSTLIDLISRMHDPSSGRILLNGIDIRSMNLSSFRRLLGIVQQDVFLFDGTIRENIAYGLRGATDADIMSAAQKANADEFIRLLPEGYETPIGERGVQLSGGQRQRISIARAIIAEPAILIFDEATSNLDAQSERLIQSALRSLLRGRTAFIVAHRLSTIVDADIIVVVERGQIREIGDHAQLMSRGGMYAAMVACQRRKPRPSDPGRMSWAHAESVPS